jgi:hypothetical protein
MKSIRRMEASCRISRRQGLDFNSTAAPMGINSTGLNLAGLSSCHRTCQGQVGDHESQKGSQKKGSSKAAHELVPRQSCYYDLQNHLGEIRIF